MKKKIIIIISIIVIGITITMLYTTFATSTTTSNDDVYDITLTGTNTVNIPKKSSKTVYYQICNTNKGKVKYGVGYRVDNNDVKVKVYWDSIDPETGIIDYGENKFIKLKISNNSTSDGNVTLSTVLGYEYGGDLIPSSGVTLVTEKINETNYLMASGSIYSSSTTFLRSSLTREQIGTITFTNDNIVPEGMTSIDVSKDRDVTVLLWYGEADSDTGLYDVYIGSDNGITSFYSGSNLFSYLTNMTSIDLKYVDTSNVTSMSNMFNRNNSLASLDVSAFNTINVERMDGMFAWCQSLKSLDLSVFDTSKVTTMRTMFSRCYSLKEINLSNFDTTNVTDMTDMFYNCSPLKELDLSSFDTSNVTSISGMFTYISSLTKIDLRKADFSKVTSYGYVFDRVPTNVTIYVKDSIQKDWIESKFTTLTGVTIAS